MSNTTIEDDALTDAEKEHWRQVRIEFIELEGRIRSIPCEYCGATVGQPCFSPKTYYVGQYHRVRKTAAGVR